MIRVMIETLTGSYKNWSNFRKDCLCYATHGCSLKPHIFQMKLLRIVNRSNFPSYFPRRIHRNGGRGENRVLSPGARHFRTDRIYLFTDFFRPKKNQESFSQRETEDIVWLLITLSTPTPTDAMLFSIPICLDSLLPITHPIPLLCVRHFYEFGV